MASRRLTIEYDLQALCRKHDLSKSELVVILKGSEPTASKQDVINKVGQFSNLDVEEFEQLVEVTLDFANHWDSRLKYLQAQLTKQIFEALEAREGDYEY